MIEASRLGTGSGVGVRLRALVSRLGVDEDGATAIEYGLIAGLMAIALVGAIASISDGLSGMYESVDSGLNAVD